jgi:hypothetical protein
LLIKNNNLINDPFYIQLVKIFNLYLNYCYFLYILNIRRKRPRKKSLDEWLRHNIWRISFNLFRSIARFLDIPRGIGALCGRCRGKKNCAFQSDGWGKSADKDAIVCQIFIRILKTLHCAKIGGLRVAGITEVEQDSETGF